MVRSREEISREIAGYLLAVIGALVLLAVLTYHPLRSPVCSSGCSAWRRSSSPP